MFEFFFLFISNSFPYPHLFVFCFSRGSIIVCRSIQRHIVALESDIDVFKPILLPIRELEQKYTSQQVMDAVGRSFAKLAKKTHDAHHVNLYSLENYRASLICSVPELTIPLFSL